jgi:hypothetical protein
MDPLWINRGLAGLSSVNTQYALPTWALNYSYIYLDVLDKRSQISADLINKSGVYCWYNLLNGNYYISSGKNLINRINDYFQPSYLKNKANLIIIRAIVKNGLGTFALVILEFSSKEEFLAREQYWLELLKPVVL